jgi:hypothetical protein
VVQVDADQHGMVIAGGHAAEGLLDGGAPALDVRVRQGRQGLRVALAGGDRLQDRPGRLDLRQRVHDR